MWYFHIITGQESLPTVLPLQKKKLDPEATEGVYYSFPEDLWKES